MFFTRTLQDCLSDWPVPVFEADIECKKSCFCFCYTFWLTNVSLNRYSVLYLVAGFLKSSHSRYHVL